MIGHNMSEKGQQRKGGLVIKEKAAPERRPVALALVAHPDDEVLIAGGTLYEMGQAGWDTHVVYFTKSDEAYYDGERKGDRSHRAMEEAKLAADILNLTSAEFSERVFFDMKVGDDKYGVLQQIIASVRKFRPDVIFTHSENDFHSDHQAMGRLVPEGVYQACREVSGDCGKKLDWEPLVLAGDVDLECRNMSNPDIIVPLSIGGYSAKLDGLLQYDSLVKEHPLFESEELAKWVEVTCKARGLYGGVDLAEGFRIVSLPPMIWLPHRLDLLMGVIE